MPQDPTLRASGAAAAVAATAWLVSGIVRATLSGSPIGSGSLTELLVPATGGALVHTGIPPLVLAGLAGALVVGAVSGLLTWVVVRRGAGGWLVVVPACWFAAVVGSVLGQLVSSALGQSATWSTVGNDLRSALWTGPYWGVVYGWAVGLVAVAVLRRSGVSLVAPAAVRARGAAVVAGVVVAVAWAVTGLLHRGALDAIGPSRTPARESATRLVSILLPNSSTDYLDDAMPAVTVAYVVAALVVGAVTGAVAWVAGRSTDPRSGRTAFVLAAWLGAVLASSVGPAIVALGYVGRIGEGWSSPTLVLTVVAASIPTSALWGLFYGWLGALPALAVLVRAQPKVTVGLGPDRPGERHAAHRA